MNPSNPPPRTKLGEKQYYQTADFAYSILKVAGLIVIFAIIGIFIENYFVHDNLHLGIFLGITALFAAIAFATAAWMFGQLKEWDKPIKLRTEWHDLLVMNSDGNRYNIRVHFHFDEWRTEEVFLEQLWTATKHALFAEARKRKADLSVDEAEGIIRGGICQTVDENKILVMQVVVSDISFPPATPERSRVVKGIEL